MIEWWEWVMIAALLVWVKGFTGLVQPNDPPFPIWPKIKAFLERKVGPFD